MNYTHGQALKLNKFMMPYEAKHNYNLDKGKFYILRLDGVHMTRNFIGKPEMKKAFLQTMKTTIQLFMQQNKAFRFAYSYSDEISLLLPIEAVEKVEYRLEKLISIYCSKITCAFCMSASKNGLILDDKIRSFDCRLLEFETADEISRYFMARQAFQISSHFIYLSNVYLNREKVVSTGKTIEKLREKGVFYEKLSREERYGILWVDKCFQIPYEFHANPKKLFCQICNTEPEKKPVKSKRKSKKFQYEKG